LIPSTGGRERSGEVVTNPNAGLLIDASSMTERDDHDEENSIVNRVDDSVVTDSKPVTRTTTQGT
jgi:hypothetical protein